jgi:hypothetical protein
MVGITPRSHYHGMYHVGIADGCGCAACLCRGGQASSNTVGSGRLQWWTLGGMASGLQRHHTGLAIHSTQPLGLVGRYSPRPSWSVPSRMQRRASAVLSGRLPLSSQYASPGPIRCIFNASSLRGLTCTGWPSWRRCSAVLIRPSQAPFASSRPILMRRTRHCEPSRALHKGSLPPPPPHPVCLCLCRYR